MGSLQLEGTPITTICRDYFEKKSEWKRSYSAYAVLLENSCYRFMRLPKIILAPGQEMWPSRLSPKVWLGPIKSRGGTG